MSEIKQKEVSLENDRLLEYIICQDVVNNVMHADVKYDNVLCLQNTFLDDNIALDVLKMKNDRLMELLVSQDLVHTVVNSLAVINDYQRYKLDLEPVSSKLKNNKEAHRDYIKITKANADTLCDIVEQARTSNLLDSALAYACMYTKQIQELAKHVKSIKKKEQKSTGKMFKNVGYKWVPTTRNFTIVGNSLGLMQNSVSPTPYVPPSKKDYEILFQPLFDKYFSPSPHAVSPDPIVVTAPRAVDPVGSPSSTTIDQDVPSASTSPTSQEIQSQVIHQGVEEQIHEHQNA
nr:hypothetical protein [Tanacetum cinerariifolium]